LEISSPPARTVGFAEAENASNAGPLTRAPAHDIIRYGVENDDAAYRVYISVVAGKEARTGADRARLRSSPAEASRFLAGRCDRSVANCRGRTVPYRHGSGNASLEIHLDISRTGTMAELWPFAANVCQFRQTCGKDKNRRSLSELIDLADCNEVAADAKIASSCS
jgi:hypothetical protein